MFSFWFQFGSFADISEVLCRIFNSKKFIHSIQYNSPGWTLFMGKFLERWIFGIRHLQHQIPYLEWVTLTSVSPEWVSTSDSLVWVTLEYPQGEYRQHQISPRSAGRQHQNPRGGCRQQQIPRYGCPQNQIPWVGCRQHWISWGGCHQHWIPWVGCRQHWISWCGYHHH